MKNTKKKLDLQRRSIQVLSPRELRAASGGGYGQGLPTLVPTIQLPSAKCPDEWHSPSDPSPNTLECWFSADADP